MAHYEATPHGDIDCRVCHAGGNDIGAAAMVLPAKSILCRR